MIKKYFQLARAIGCGFLEDRCFRTAAALAFSTLFALVPIVVLVVLIFNALPVSDVADQQIKQFLLDNFVTHSVDTIQQHMHTFIQQSQHLSIMGLFMLVCVAILMVFTMERAFDQIWRVPNSRHGLSGFFMYWSVLTLLPVLISLGFFVVTSIHTWPFFENILQHPWWQSALPRIVPFVLIFFALFLLYLTLPNCKVPVVSAWLSSFVATISFFIARYLYGFYTMHLTVQMSVYGALSVLPVFLIWVYWNWMVVLLGVEVGYHYALFRQQQASEQHVEP